LGLISDSADEHKTKEKIKSAGPSTRGHAKSIWSSGGGVGGKNACHPHPPARASFSTQSVALFVLLIRLSSAAIILQNRLFHPNKVVQTNLFTRLQSAQ
jgi:hypothetical protein